MKKNVGSIDKAIRILVAAAFLILVFTKVITGVLAIVLVIIAIMFTVTSLISFCPLYIPFGINTIKKKA
jgi:hypothetical protein